MYKETLVDFNEHLWTFLGSFFGIGLIGLINSQYFTAYDNLFLIGSFGASSVLIYGIINSPLAQPRNLIGGHLVCALVGVTIHKLIPSELWLSCALSVSLSIVFALIDEIKIKIERELAEKFGAAPMTSPICAVIAQAWK